MRESITVRRSRIITPRQRQVVALIAAGCSNEEVGARLGISPRTAKAHSDVLRQKLGVPRRRQIPIAFRVMTGEDPLAESLSPGLSRRRGCRQRPRPLRLPRAHFSPRAVSSRVGSSPGQGVWT